MVCTPYSRYRMQRTTVHLDSDQIHVFLLLKDLADLGQAALDCIHCFPVPVVVQGAVEEALLKQVLPSIRRLRGLRIPPIRTTTSLEPIKVIVT